MIVNMFRIPISPGREEEFATSFRERKKLVDTMKGFVSMDVLKPLEGVANNVHLVMTKWASKDDFEAWTQSEAFGQAHSQKHPGMASGPPSVEFFEVITSSGESA